LIVKLALPAPAPVQATRAVPAPPFAVFGTVQRHETAPPVARFAVSFVGLAPGRVIVVAQLLPVGLTPAETKRLAPAVTVFGATRTRTVSPRATALDAIRRVVRASAAIETANPERRMPGVYDRR
jgi:hypothetical protein